MRKVFCDICDEEIVNYHMILNVMVEHRTNRSEIVGNDDFGPVDVCYKCATNPVVLTEILRARRGLKDMEAEAECAAQAHEMSLEINVNESPPRVELVPR